MSLCAGVAIAVPVQMLIAVPVQMLVSGSALCRSVYARSCNAGARDSLRDLYVQEDNFQQQAYLRLEEAYAATVSNTVYFPKTCKTKIYFVSIVLLFIKLKE